MKEPETKETTSATTERALAPMDFSTFVLSLASSAMVNLGLVDTPLGADAESQNQAKQAPDLPAARQLIDIIGVLEEKTRGNLNDSEEKLLKSVLYDLRVRFCDAQKQNS